MTKTFRPMLASPADLDKVVYPVFASPKLDGIRAAVVGGRLLSRTLKEIPSRHIYNMFNQHKFEGLDGELIVGPTTSPTCYRDTVSGVMADNKTPDFKYHVFDLWDTDHGYSSRLMALRQMLDGLKHAHIEMVEHTTITCREDLDTYEAKMVGLGHEGIMLNGPWNSYKFGRATVKGGELLKVKRFTDFEGVVIGFEEEMENTNAAEKNELGRTKRSTAAAGLIGKNTLGAFRVRDATSGVEFKIGTGMTAADRKTFWNSREKLLGQTVKYKSFEVGVKTAPRHPVFLGFRPAGA